MSEANWYATVFKSWPVKQVGAKPTAEMLASVHKLGARPGKQALACAMALRPAGVTGSQIIMACGAPQLNKMRGFISDALLKRVAVPLSPEGHQVYKLELTPKGLQRIKRADDMAAKADEAGKGETKPVKAAAKAKGERKHKPKAEQPAADTGTLAAPEAVVVPPATDLPEAGLNT
jgi:hypothetical protein